MMSQEERYLELDGFMWPFIAPPDITEKPRGFGWEGCLFMDALEIALYMERNADNRSGISGFQLLEALRRKWPDAVEAALPEIRKRDVAARVAGRKPVMPTKRAPARVAAMA